MMKTLSAGLLAACAAALASLTTGAWAAGAADSLDGVSGRPRLAIGVTEFALTEDREEILHALEKALVPLSQNYTINIHVFSVPQLEAAARGRQLDLVLGSAGLVARLGDIGAKTIVSSVGRGGIDANQNEGSAFIVRRDRSDLKTIGDLAGQRMAANRATGFSGYLIALGEIAMAGYDPDTFFADRFFFGEQSASRRIAAAVQKGFADVGILKLCGWKKLIESNPELDKELRVLAPVESRSACKHSTRLYPAHTLAALPHVSPTIVTDLTLAFLEMPPTADGRSWAVATDFLSVDNLYRALEMGPYAYLKESVLSRFIDEYKPFIITVLLAALVLLLQLAHTRRLLEKRTRQVKAMARREADQERRLLFLERNTTVSQLSSMIAHELHQPLAAIRLYAKGLERLERRAAASDDVLQVVESIASEASRAKEIVERVRLYAKNRRPPGEDVHVSDLLASACSHFAASTLTNGAPAMKVRIAEAPRFTDCVLHVAALEMELVFLNLMKNARDARATDLLVESEISGEREGEEKEHAAGHAEIALRFIDNGPTVTEETMKRLTTALTSTKPEGLGLGLGIARRIVEEHAGRMSFAANAPRPGLTVTVVLPVAEKTHEGTHEDDIEDHASNAGAEALS